MDDKTKRFLALFAAVYLIGGIVINVLLGPPGMSSEYMARRKAEHDRYLVVTKSDAYKLFLERPRLNPPGERLAVDIAFLEGYESTDAFIEEADRRKLYDLVFDFFNAIMVVGLVYRFAKNPVIGLLDSGIEKIRVRVGQAESARKEAVERRLAADNKLGGVKDEAKRIDEEMRQRIAREKSHIEENTGQSVELLDRETQDRKRNEELIAERALKRELMDAAITLFVRDYRSRQSAEQESVLVQQFADQLKEVK